MAVVAVLGASAVPMSRQLKQSGGLAMLAARSISIAATAAAVLGLCLSGRSDGDQAKLTRPTPVALDFRARPVGEVVKTIESRTGKKVVAFGRPMTKAAPGQVGFGGPVDIAWRDRPVTLESAKPVGFWEAIDRLAVAGKLAYRVGDFGDATGVVFEGDGDAPSPACYAGPFRIGLVGIHEYHESFFVRGPWVQFSPSGYAVAADAAEIASAPKDGGPFYAELNLAAEPGLVCRRDGPLRNVEALDDVGQSLVAPSKEVAAQWMQVFAPPGSASTPIVRIPLRRPQGAGASKSIKTLRGAIPFEVGALKPQPAIVIRLGDSAGKTFRGGGAIFTVDTDKAEADGRIKFAVSYRLSGDEAPAVRDARLEAMQNYQLRMVDAQGAKAFFGSGSRGGDGHGGRRFSYEYTPRPQVPHGPPVEFQYYDLDRAAWLASFEFHDIPLP